MAGPGRNDTRNPPILPARGRRRIIELDQRHQPSQGSRSAAVAAMPVTGCMLSASGITKSQMNPKFLTGSTLVTARVQGNHDSPLQAESLSILQLLRLLYCTVVRYRLDCIVPMHRTPRP
jgi:hypothetical protein